MEPNKFEDNIKKQLQEREIKPSASAWEKVSARLDTEEENKPGSYFWLGIAASIIGLLIFSLWLWNGSDVAPNTTPQIVTVPEQKNETQIEKATKITNEKVDETMQLPTESDLVERENIPSVIQEKASAVTNNNTVAEIILEDKLTKITTPMLNDSAIASDSHEKIIDGKIAEVLAKVTSMEENAKALSDAEVDSLLLRAQKELLSDAIFKQDKKVDAMALLANVEDELDQSFRDQIFDKLKTGFLKVRTAVAQRND